MDPEVKRRVTDARAQAQAQVLGGIVYPPRFPQETSSGPVCGSGSVSQHGEDTSELVPVLLVQGMKKELDLRDPR